MRVLFLTLYPDTAASPRYRVTQFLPALCDQGMICDVASAVSEGTFARRGLRRALWYHTEELRRRAAQIAEARNYDVVVLQKALTSLNVRGMLGRFRRHVPRYVYDVDDAVHLAPPVSVAPRWQWAVERDQISALMRDARVVLAGNAWLAEAVHEAGGVAEVFPTVVDTDRFHPASSRSGGFRVGWIGSPSTAPSLRLVAPALREVEVHAMGAGGAHGIEGARDHAWSLDAEVPFVQSLSVGLMPLPKDDWTRGKCALKALQYMACGVPCVATPFGAVTEIIEHGVNGLFADTEAEWRDAVARLRGDRYRAALGDAARATVEARYSLRYAAPRMKQLLEQAAESA